MWKVIIADDEKLICKLVQTLVDWNSLGMEIVGTAENGLEALALIEEKSPNILITDIRMPGCNGLELIKQAREIQPDIEIVIISGYAHFEYAQTAIAYGVGNYILKPIKQAELTETLQKIVKRLEVSYKNNLSGSLPNAQNDLKKLRENLLKDILNGKTGFTADRMEKDYYFKLQEGVLQPFLFKIDFDVEKTGEAAFSIISQKAEELFTVTMPGVCKECLFAFQDFTGYGILNYGPENKDEVRKRLREFLKQMEANKNLFGDVEFSLALGRGVTDINVLPDAMEETKQIIAERLIEGCGRMLEGAPIRSGMPKQQLLEKYSKGIEHAIEMMEEKEAREAGDSLKEAVMRVPHITGREILEMVLDAGKLFVLRAGTENTEKIQREFVFRCGHCSHREQLFAELNKLQAEMIAEIKDKREKEATRPIRVAKQYILENYQKNITLEEICEMVGFSSAYFSVMFKKETGEGFAKYVTRVRIDKAKELLRETNMPVSEVCEKVGYNDRKHFTHTFHKMTGVNPAEFRRLYG